MEPQETFEITVRGDRLSFAAGHFLTYGGGQCEALHGHNYRVAVTVRGELDEHGLVLDFLVLRDAIEALLAPLDHRTLLAGRSAHLRLAEEVGTVTAITPERRMTFPLEDVVVLPISNTSAELMAAYLAGELLERLGDTSGGAPSEIVVEVEESPGLTGRCRVRPRA
ncbi:MAG: 6-carboxytetrahydropterin synthase [Candidatus Palauibacterales bacterium]|nr:6-carboxytetrahydropterin synthase [Candidatus Palauibacterales bacterium]MDP2530751.1 6-carboxytetrahydropterin synthase [Candidatus Palauibacterales bacterium]MDP2582729.1 6-carboxytetrahydropterin synthase [Candidatus Palauibacterales bacterium]